MKARNGGDESKPVLYFSDAKKGLVLNKTNSDRIAHSYTWETDSWKGRKIDLYTATVDAFGEEVEAVRVKIPAPAGTVPGAPTLGATKSIPEPEEILPSASDELSDLPPEDEIPF